MASVKILRIPRSNPADDYVLIKASPAGKHELDFDLLATEGVCPYVGKGMLLERLHPLTWKTDYFRAVRQRKLKDLQSKSYEGDLDEWESIIKHIFGVEKGSTVSNATKDLEVVADIHGEDPAQTITIVFRKRIQQITQRLGSIELHQNDDEEVQLFDWTGQAVQDSQSAAAEVARLTSNLVSANSTIKSLESKLDELVKLKEEHDKQMLSQFAALLNEKKAKIRISERILLSANIDPKKLKGLERAAVEEIEKRHQPGSSARGKRKATTASVESSDEDAFEKMDADDGQPTSRDDFQADTESDRSSTPDKDTEEEEEEEEQESGRPSTSRAEQSIRQASRVQSSQQRDAKPTPSLDKVEASSSPPPPRRDLPFNRRKDVKRKEDEKHQANVSPQADDEETATEDDDEL